MYIDLCACVCGNILACVFVSLCALGNVSVCVCVREHIYTFTGRFQFYSNFPGSCELLFNVSKIIKTIRSSRFP